MTNTATETGRRLPTGIAGLDHILDGGYPEGRIMLVEGAPGTGKSSLALQFLCAGAKAGKSALFVSVAQSLPEIEMVAASHGMDLSGIDVVTPQLGSRDPDRVFSVDSEEADLVGLVGEVEGLLQTKRPDLLVFDSLLELRLLASTPTAYRRELVSLRNLIRASGTTAMLIDHIDSDGSDRHAEGVVHGVVRLEADTPDIGPTRRRLTVVKVRGAGFVEGRHDFRIRTGGLEVFPRVLPHGTEPAPLEERLVPPQPDFARMIGGGVEFGTSLLIAGQAGSGKSTVASLLGLVAAERGVPTAMFLFEERAEVLRARSAGVGLDLARHEDSGAMRLQHVDPAEVSSGEFAAVALGAVDAGVRVVVIDSLNGYLEAQPGDTHVMSHMHALIQALTQRGVLVILTLAQSGLLGEPPETGVDTSFLADAVLLLRQYEAGADIRRSIAMLKKRQGEHDRRFQELVIAPGTVEVRPMSEDAMQRTRGAARLGDA